MSKILIYISEVNMSAIEPRSIMIDEAYGLTERLQASEMVTMLSASKECIQNENDYTGKACQIQLERS